jgi:gliding motility-associated-like protein
LTTFSFVTNIPCYKNTVPFCCDCNPYSNDNRVYDRNNFDFNDNMSVFSDFESKNSYTIRIRTTDKNNEFFEQSFIINITDVNEAPVLKQDTFAINENALIGEFVGTVTASNPESSQLLNYKIIQNANVTLPFVINENTGEITVSSELNYANKNQYKLVVIVSDNDPDSKSDTNVIIINVNEVIKTKQALPAKNYMSPNGDGVNDYFEISNVELYKDYSLTIYNEFGLVVYKALNNYNNDWDGTYNGNRLQTAAYFYVFKNNFNGIEFKGVITIVSQ